jgi:hypothetical protein
MLITRARTTTRAGSDGALHLEGRWAEATPRWPGVPEVLLAPVGERRSGLKMVGGHPLTS